MTNSPFENLDHLIHNNPDFADIYFQDGVKKQESKDFKGAVKDFSKAIEINPKISAYYYHRGCTRAGLKEHKSAIDDFKKAIELSPQTAEYFEKLGYSQFKCVDKERAKKNLEKAIQLGSKVAKDILSKYVSTSQTPVPRSTPSLPTKSFYRKPFTIYRENIVSNSIKSQSTPFENLGTLLQKNPNSSELYLNGGMEKINLQDYWGAIKDFDKAIELNPSDSSAFYHRGYVKEELKDYKGAIADFSKAIDLDPDNVDAYNDRGFAKYHLKDFIGAINDFSAALKLDSEDSNIYYNRGTSRFDSQDYNGALDDFSNAYILGIEDDSVSFYIGVSKLKLQDSHGAILELSKAIEMNSAFEDAYYYRGLAHLNLTNYQEALRDLTKTIELDPSDALYWLHRGIIYHNLNNDESACNDWEKATYLGSTDALDWLRKYKREEKKPPIPILISYKPSLQNKEPEESRRIIFKIPDTSDIFADQKESKRSVTGELLDHLFTLRHNWQAFNAILINNGINKLYHFTDHSNIQSIINNGGLFSWDYCGRQHIAISAAGGGHLSRSLDTRYNLQDFVRVCFTRNHPMMFVAMDDGRIRTPVILEISTEVCFFQYTKFSNMNATKTGHSCGSEIEDLNRIRFDLLRYQKHFDIQNEAERKYFQAEVLVKTHIPLKYIMNLDNYR